MVINFENKKPCHADRVGDWNLNRFLPPFCEDSENSVGVGGLARSPKWPYSCATAPDSDRLRL